jgi:hypothetical protein
LKAIEAETKVRMEELRVDEEKVAEILTQVSMSFFVSVTDADNF